MIVPVTVIIDFAIFAMAGFAIWVSCAFDAGASLTIALATASTIGAETLKLPRLGAVSLISASGSPTGVVILFSDPGTAASVAPESLQALAEAGRVVAVVDTGRYLAELDRSQETCHRASDDLIVLKSLILDRQHLSQDTPVVLAGPGAGGFLAYAILAQSRAGQFSGAVAFGFHPDLPGRHPLCSGAPHIKTPAGYRYMPSNNLSGFWRIATPSPDDDDLRAYAGNHKDIVFRLRPYDDLASAVISVLEDATRPSPNASGGIADLPLVLLPADHRGKTMAIIYSGDGGWRDLDKQIGEELQGAGIPVVGVDTLRGFWHRRAPEAAAGDLERIMDHFTKVWGTPDVLLIGYSFGADLLPFLVNRVNPAVGRHIRQISLLGLSKSADFEIHVSGWLGATSGEALALGPELRKLDASLVQCFLGREEQEESGCRDASLAGAEIIETAGGHHFDENYAKLARIIIDGAVRRGAALQTGR
jgi:type IV secretory pathway VirJ component